MKRIPTANKAIALPLIGLYAAWLAFMGGGFADLYVPQPTYDSMGNVVSGNEIFHISPYLFLIGIAATALASKFGQRLAIQAIAETSPENKLARAAYRFTTLGIIISLLAGAIFAIGNFMSAFNIYGSRAENLGLRFLNTYLPILLATGLVVYVLLSAFVFNHGREKTADGKKPAMSEVQRALALGYAVNILTTAVAIIFGLIVYDITRTNLEVWVWVIIIAIVVAGVVLGTRFSNKAKTAKQEQPRPRTALAAGAASLNFVLSVIFGAVVSIMGFSFGSSAIYKLQVWSEVPFDCKDQACQSTYSISGITWDWLIQEMAPAKVLILLAIVGIYLTITGRNAEAKK